MDFKFILPESDKKDLLKNDISKINQFLLDNNAKQVSQIYDFFNSKSSLLLVNGFMGSGKTSVINHVLDVAVGGIKLYYDCFETTILDDIMLSFFNDFRILSEQGKIFSPKSKAENFAQKINSYFQCNQLPITIVINSFEEVLKNNRTEIIDFIKHLCTLANIKVILVSRTFDYENFDLDYKKVTVLALEKTIFEKYLRSEDLKQIGPLSDELYKQSRGYFFYVSLAIKIMKCRNLSLIQFIDAYAKSFLSFNDFLLREAILMIDPISGHLFRFLTVIRHPVSINLLKTLNLYDEKRVEFFINNLLFSKSKDSLYLKDYYKIIAENSISSNVIIKIHQGCVDLYNSQLPLKPFERDLKISRQTMRNEIDYHSMFIPRKLVIQDVVEPKLETSIPEPPVVDEEPKEEKIKDMSFIFDDNDPEVLDKIADSIKDFVSYTDNQMKEFQEESDLSLDELVDFAQREEHRFNYKHAISLYMKAITKFNDPNYKKYLPQLYTSLATCCQQSSDWYDAQKYFEVAKELFEKVGDLEKVNQMRFSIANACFMTFKKDRARELLLELESKDISDELRIKVYNLLATISSNSNIAYNYYKKALEVNQSNINKDVLAELYYKFAVLCEDRADDEIATEYYKKCIRLKDTPYLSSAFSNLATLYDDIGERDLAIKYFYESLQIDNDNKNLSGMYSTTLKLAEIYSAFDKEKAIQYYNQAIEYSYELKDAFYIMSATTALGDFYFNRREDKLAYDNYKIAYELALNSNYKENSIKILLRIEDIKLRVGEERFNQFEK